MIALHDIVLAVSIAGAASLLMLVGSVAMVMRNERRERRAWRRKAT